MEQLEEAYDMPYIAAKRFVDKLVDVRVLCETITGYARNRFFATEVFKALEAQDDSRKSTQQAVECMITELVGCS